MASASTRWAAKKRTTSPGTKGWNWYKPITNKTNILAINKCSEIAQYDNIPLWRCSANILIWANIGFGTVSAPFSALFLTKFDPSDLICVNFAWWLLSCWLKIWCKMPMLSISTLLWKRCDWGNSNVHAWSRNSAEMCPSAPKSAMPQYIDRYRQ